MDIVYTTELIYVAELKFGSYTIRVIDTSEEAACKKIYKAWKQAIKAGGYIDTVCIKNWKELRDYGISVYGTKLGQVEWI